MEIPDEFVEARITSRDWTQWKKDLDHIPVPPTDREKARAVLNECESLWSELQTIRNQPGFRERRDETPAFRQWMERADMLLSSRPDQKTIGSEIHALPGWLIAVAIDYSTNPRFGNEESVLEEWFINAHLPFARQVMGDYGKKAESISFDTTTWSSF